MVVAKFLSFFIGVIVSMPLQATNVPSSRELLKQGRVDDAVSAARQELAANPANSAELYYILCRANYLIGKFDDAIQDCGKASSLSPKNSDYHLWLGRSYGEKAERSSWFTAISLAKKTREQFETAVQLNGENLEARSDLAEFYLEAPSFLGGGVDKARSQADALSRTSMATAHLVRARVAEKGNDAASAEQELKSAVASSNKPEAWVDLASFYRRQKRYSEMEDAIRKAVAAVGRPGSAYVDAAALLLRTGRDLPEAKRLLTEYVRSGEPADDAPLFRVHFLLGQVAERRGDAAGAVKEYESALSFSREYTEAREALNRLKH